MKPQLRGFDFLIEHHWHYFEVRENLPAPRIGFSSLAPSARLPPFADRLSTAAPPVHFASCAFLFRRSLPFPSRTLSTPPADSVSFRPAFAFRRPLFLWS